MVIGQFCDVYPPELDGVGMVTKSYAEELSQFGDECYYVAPYAAQERNYDFQALLYHSVKVPGEAYRTGMPALDPKYRRKVSDIEFDIVHAHSPFASGRESLHLAKRRNIPIVATFHSKYYDDFYDKTHNRHLASAGTNAVVQFYNQCDEVWAVSEKTAEVLRGYGYSRSIQIMPNGTNPCSVNPADIAEAFLRFGLDEKPVFLFVGQLNWKKNIRKVLEAAAIYAKQHPFHLVLAGQGPDEKEIRKYAKELGILPHVIFTGHIADRRLLMGLYACADMLVFPSLYDNAPMVVREAASAGTASILVRGSCAAECIDSGVNGLLCEDDAQSIANCMEIGVQRKKQLGDAAKETIPKPWAEIVRTVRLRYADLISNKKISS